MKNSKLAIAAVFLLSATASFGQDGNVQIMWGILPFDDGVRGANSTLLMDGSSEMAVSTFNGKPYTLRLAEVGDGTFNEIGGFASMSWIAQEQAVDASVRWKNVTLAGTFTSYAATGVPVTLFGDVNDLDEETLDDLYFEYGDSYEDEYYTDLWSKHVFAVVVYDEFEQRAYRLSGTSGGSSFDESVFASFEGPIIQAYNPQFPMYAQQPFTLIAANSSKAVYLGAEIPQRCVWMADKGLTAADLAGYDEKAVALAMALDKVPAEVAGGVELAVDSFALDPQAGTATLVWHFTATDGNGESAAVSSLRGGARLLLETASSAGDLGTENASKQEVSLSSASLTIPTSGDTLFARLVLDTP